MGRRRTHAPRSDFGKFLDGQLRRLDLEPAQFAEKSGLSLSHVYQLLRGDRADPRGTTFRKAATALDMSETQMARAVFGDGSPPLDFPSTGAPVDKATFFAIMSAFPSGVAIVTTIDAEGQPKGTTLKGEGSRSAETQLVAL